MIDDGAIFYLNGVALSPRFNMSAGAVTTETSATANREGVLISIIVPTAGLIAGTNRISAEVHQFGTSSSDLVFGLKMDMLVQIPAQPLRNNDNQWLELTNRSAAAVDLTGWDFNDGLTFTFPPGTKLPPGESACLVRDPALFSAAFPAARVLGTFSGSLSRTGEHIVLRDALRNTVDEVRYYDSGHWAEYADGGCASLELRDLDADNSNGGSWAASDETSRTAWRTYTAVAAASNGGPDDQWPEFNMGLMAAGELWIDDIKVTENPAGSAFQKLTASVSSFTTQSAWRLRGNHRHSQIIPEPGNPGNSILRLVATSPTEHMHNQIETTLTSAISNGQTYTISFRARWVGGSNQLLTRCYFHRLPKVNVIDRVANPGTPGAVNSRNIANAGPTFTSLNHSPSVPAAGAVTTVTCRASDPDGVDTLALL